VLIAEGFDEREAVFALSAFREAGLYARSVGMTGGAISGSRGIRVTPDLTLNAFEHECEVPPTIVVLPGGEGHLMKLSHDPRVHRLLGQVLTEGGYVIKMADGGQILKREVVEREVAYP
jgi:4-methyl-5(b-hydroxyethyl)-thiazole monophosphate biosynthesis